MARTRMQFELDKDAVAEFLKSEELGRELEPFGDHVRRAANATARAEGYDRAEYVAKRFTGHDRQRIHIAAGNKAAYAAEIARRALTRATGGALR